MKKISIKKSLLLFCMSACMFSMTACTDTISSQSAKESAKEQEVFGYENELAEWSTDMILYLDHTNDDKIRSDAEAAKTLSDTNNTLYAVDQKGMSNNIVELYNGWIKSREDLGALQSIDKLDINISSKTSELCTISVQTTYEKRACTFEFVIDKDMNLESGAINPEYTTGEKVEKAALNTVIGMGTVFVVLIFISFIISLLKHVNKIGKKEEPKKENTPAPVAQVEEVEDDSEEVDDLELVAVITAAIAASENTPADGLVVRSIKKVHKTDNWRR